MRNTRLVVWKNWFYLFMSNFNYLFLINPLLQSFNVVWDSDVDKSVLLFSLHQSRPLVPHNQNRPLDIYLQTVDAKLLDLKEHKRLWRQSCHQNKKFVGNVFSDFARRKPVESCGWFRTFISPDQRSCQWRWRSQSSRCRPSSGRRWEVAWLRRLWSFRTSPHFRSSSNLCSQPPSVSRSHHGGTVTATSSVVFQSGVG